MSLALLITAIGMSLVFAAILLLWGLMELVVRVLPEKAEAVEVAPPPLPETETPTLRERAAVVAVAVALALQAEKATPAEHFPWPATALVSAWQAVRRSQQLSQRGPVRKN